MSKETHRSSPTGSLGSEPWRKTFETLRGRFESGSADCPGLSCLLIHFGAGVQAPSILPLLTDRIAAADAVIGNFDLSPPDMIIRHLYFANNPAGLDRLPVWRRPLAAAWARCRKPCDPGFRRSLRW